MRGYSSTPAPCESGNANKTMLTVIGATTVRPSIFDVLVGNSQAPADAAAQVALARFTAAGTTAASAPTPLPLDPGDVAALATLGWTHSAEPTYTAGGSGVEMNFNQRTPVRWVANPGYEFKGAASANNGVGLRLVASTAAMILRGVVHWYE